MRKFFGHHMVLQRMVPHSPKDMDGPLRAPYEFEEMVMLIPFRAATNTSLHSNRHACHRACSVTASYKPPMLVTRVRLPACAVVPATNAFSLSGRPGDKCPPPKYRCQQLVSCDTRRALIQAGTPSLHVLQIERGAASSSRLRLCFDDTHILDLSAE